MTGRDLSSMDSGKVCITRDDAIDAIGSLELRVEDLEKWSEFWRKEGQPRQADERREAAERLKGVIERFREAMKR